MENTIKTVQGIIDIERTKSDRQLNHTVAIAGVGLATSQIASAAILAQLPDEPTPPTYKIYVFVVSLLIGAIIAFLTYKLLQKPRE
ncbi:MAG: hypothetical protein VKL59_23290 [Nostocaceae cyanobacterium]|nr:hypothetical protein [Nostocaceae cyanobacterium]